MIRIDIPNTRLSYLITYKFGGKQLSVKELDVLKWACAGKTAWEIALICNVSESTVKFHLRNIYSKLGVSNRAQAVSEAHLRGLLT
jgi:DNA-binding CsgD family transcriptional regulator